MERLLQKGAPLRSRFILKKILSSHDGCGRSRIQRGENEAVCMKASGSDVSGPPQPRKNVSIWDASVSAVPWETAGIKGSSSCGGKEMQSHRLRPPLAPRADGNYRAGARADGGRCSAESAETQPRETRRGTLAPEWSASRR